MKLGQPVPGIELVGRSEERLSGDHVHVEAGRVMIPELVAERRLGGAALGHVVLRRSEHAPQLCSAPGFSFLIMPRVESPGRRSPAGERSLDLHEPDVLGAHAREYRLQPGVVEPVQCA